MRDLLLQLLVSLLQFRELEAERAEVLGLGGDRSAAVVGIGPKERNGFAELGSLTFGDAEALTQSC